MPAQLTGPAFNLTTGGGGGAGAASGGAGAASGGAGAASASPWGLAAAVAIPLLMGLFGVGGGGGYYSPPPPPPPPPSDFPLSNPPAANTHGIGESGMTPEQSQMISPRTQISQALLKQRMGG